MLVMDPDHVDLLILGAGWTSTFLIPLLVKENITYAATTTTGHDGTIAFKFDPASSEEGPFRRLPSASTVLITFPLTGKGPSALLTNLYKITHPDASTPRYMQLGATSIWTGSGWHDENSPYERQDIRAEAEDELREVANGAVLNLAGLYGGTRQPRKWVDRVVTSKEVLRAKDPLHLIHGEDVAIAIAALHRRFTPGKRWLVCDMHLYDWWDLVGDWANDELREWPLDIAPWKSMVERRDELVRWLRELMEEEGVKALPRDTTLMGRKLDGRAFWNEMGVWPSHGRVR